MEINSICISADMLNEQDRLLEFHGENTLMMLKGIIKFINEVTIYPTDIYCINSFFDRNIFYLKSKINPCEIYTRIIDYNEISESSKNYFYNHFNFDILIGYELTDLTINLISELGIKYINIWLHPIRYLTDEIFILQTNVSEISNRLSAIQMDKRYFFIAADYIKILLKRDNPLLNIVNENSAAIFLQTHLDKTLRKKEGIISIRDFEKDIAHLSNLFKKIYVIEHPLDPENEDSLYLTSLKNCEKISCNSYQLLCCENLNLVCTISSSIGTEAHFFGKNVIFFNKPVIDIFNPLNFSINYSIYDINLWEYLILGKSFKINNNDFYLAQPKNMVRNVLNQYYAYSYIEEKYN